MTTILGIDPGLKGSLVAFDFTSPTPGPLFVLDMPSPFSPSALHIALKNALSAPLAGPRIVGTVIEQVGSRPHQQGAFSFGFSTGVIHGIITSLLPGTPLAMVSPVRWKPALGLVRQPKSASMALAMELAPTLAPYLTLQKHDGRAEAFLLAFYAYKKGLFVPPQPTPSSSPQKFP